jgi:RNA polymerase sigma factor (sigma-70 family)
LPYTQRRKIKMLFEAKRDISAETGGDAGREVVARRLRTSVGRVDQILQIRSHELSFDRTIHADSDTPIHESLPDRATPDPERALLGSETRARIRRGLLELGPRERHVLEGRFGLGDEPSRSLRQIGQELGLTREAIRLIEERAKTRLRRILDGRPARPGSRTLRRPPRRDIRPEAR